jgi:Flp pilus assembly protein CpaB
MNYDTLILMTAIASAAGYIVYLRMELAATEELVDDAMETLDEAHEAVQIYQDIIMDVALNRSVLEYTQDGRVTATRISDDTQVH